MIGVDILRFLQNRCSEIFLKIRMKTLAPKSFQESCRPAVCNFIAIKKKLWFRCFTVNFAKYCRTLFNRTPLGGYFKKISGWLFFNRTPLSDCF